MIEPKIDSRLDDYVRWHHAQVRTLDLDPVYPWLRHLADRWGLDQAQRGWLVQCHVIWYHPGSTLRAFQAVDHVKALPRSFDQLESAGLLSLPTGVERRGHRDRLQLAKHLLALPYVLPDGLYAYVDQGETWNWRRLNDRLAGIPGNGRWAAYKTAEMLQKVAGAPVIATDAGHRYSSGPRKGLADLFGDRVPLGQNVSAVQRLDRMTAALGDHLGEPDVAQVETSLCDFHSVIMGHYYLGHDIDSMQSALHDRRAAVRGSLADDAWQARSEVFDHRLLGEHQGWNGVRADRKRAYRDTGRLLGVDHD